MKKQILWISMMVPYDSVGHASGKTENYYLKYIQLHSDFQMTLLSLCKDFEIPRLDLDKYGIKNKVYVRKWKGFLGTIRRGIAWISKFNILNKYAGLTPCDISHGTKKLLRELYWENYVPDCIILQWTEILFLLPEIKKYYPHVPIVAIEEDVSYLGQLRRWKHSKGVWKGFYKKKYEKVKALELQYLNQTDLVVLNNQKDFDLVIKDGLNARTFVWSCFFQLLLEVSPKQKAKDIIYYGAMSREENWRSAEWFILNVMPLLKEDDIRFVVIGSSPNRRLYRYCSDRVIVKGFVEDVSSELADAMCLVAPLVLGAGIKIKIIEALSCGIPVLTNSIGIEGIPAEDGKSYFHCESPLDYVNVIEKLCRDQIDLHNLQLNAKAVVKENFNYEKSAGQFIGKLEELIGA